MEDKAPGPAKGYQKKIAKEAVSSPPPKKTNTDYSSPAAKKWPFFIAALESGNVDDVTRMIEEGINVNLSRDGVTPLMVAASKGHIEIAGVILQAGVNVNAKNDDGWNALHKAAFDQAGTGIVDLLLQSGIDVEARTNAKKTALQLAEESKHRDIVRVINKQLQQLQQAAQEQEAFLNSAAGKPYKQQKLLETLAAYSSLMWLPPAALGIAGIVVGLLSGTVIRAGIIGIIAGLLVDLSVFIMQKKISADLEKRGPLSGPNLNALSNNNDPPQSLASDLPILEVSGDAVKTKQRNPSLGQVSERKKYSLPTMPPKLIAAIVSALIFVVLSTALFLYRGPLVHWFYAKKVERSGITFTSQAFLAEVAKNNEAAVDLFLKAGIPLDAKNEKGQTALAIAAEKESMNLLDKLAVLSPALLDQPDSSGNTPLMAASRLGREQIVIALVERGAAVNLMVPSSIGAASALQAAVDSSDKTDAPMRIAQYLLQHGAEVQGRNTAGRFPLLFAADHGRIDIAKVLIEKGAKVNEADRQGNFALQSASCKGYASFVEMLANSGANMSMALPDGQTPLMCAVREGHRDTVRMLLERGAPVEAQAKSGSTALTDATRMGNAEIASLLLAKGADPVGGYLPDTFTGLNGKALGVSGKKSKPGELLKRIATAAALDGYTISAGPAVFQKIPQKPKGSWNKVLGELAATNNLLLVVKDKTVFVLAYDPAGVKPATVSTGLTATVRQ